MSVLWSASTNEAYAFKILIEALNYYLNKKGSFTINSKGIFLGNTDKNEAVFCDLKLYAENFQHYVCSKEEIFFSVNLNTLYTNMLKKIKKKDTIHLRIIEENGSLVLRITKESPDDKDNPSASKIPIIESKHIPVEPPSGYDRPINVVAKVFQRACREITAPASKEIEITCWNDSKLKLYASKDGTIENEAYLGGNGNGENEVETFKSKFIASHIIKPVKLAGLSNSVKIYVKDQLPLYYKINIASLGELGIYIKSNEQLTSEKDTIDSDD